MPVPRKPVALVSMPVLSPRFPSFELALLKPTLERAGIPTQTFSLFVHFAQMVGWRLNDALACVYDCLLGEWLWSKAAFGDFEAGDYLSEFADEIGGICEAGGATVEDLRRIHDRDVFQFIDHCVAHLDWSQFALVGFSVAFQQLTASLAMARALKQKHPEVPIILGGPVFEDEIGLQVMKHCPQIDFVHCGDGDVAFPELVQRLYDGRSLAGLKGPMWRRGSEIVFEGRAQNLADLDQTPVPDFDEHFQACRSAGYLREDEVASTMLPVETARGCWHGARQQCTFCGLNRAGLDFRSKKPREVLEMLEALHERYGTANFNAIDTIMEPGYLEDLFDKLAERHTDFRLHYQIRPYLRRADLKRLKRGGVYEVQPGIESFNSHLLKAMNKGVAAIRTLELLKWSSYYGIRNLYNLLVGVPGEAAEDYCEQAALLPKLFHLEPPLLIARIHAERGSPMYERPADFGITSLSPRRAYRHIFPEKVFDLQKVSYYFEHTVKDPLPAEAYAECYRLVDEWRRRWAAPQRPFLTYTRTWKKLEIVDGRAEKVVRHTLCGAQAELYERCGSAVSLEDLVSRSGGEESFVREALADWTQKGLVVALDGKYLGLALPLNPHH
jgi:ribosomal peptide maturation radical SAM protein 1